MTQEENIAQLKEKFIEYFLQLPVQKLAAASIGRSEDTISIWKSQDSEFSDRIEQAKAEWALKNVKGIKSKEWLLERLMKEQFGVNSTPQGLTQNNYFNLNDEQLDALINSKIKQVGAGDASTGEATQDSGESA